MGKKIFLATISLLGIIGLPLFICLAYFYESTALGIGIVVSLFLIGLAEFIVVFEKLIKIDLKSTKAWLYMLELIAIFIVFFVAQICFFVAYLNGNIFFLIFGVLYAFLGSMVYFVGIIVILIRWLYLKYVKKV